MGNRLVNSPYFIVVVCSLVLVVFLFMVGGSISGGYFLMIHYVNNFNTQQHATQAKNSLGLCRAVQQMDLAGHGATFSTSNAAAYGRKLSAAIHQLYISSGCLNILNGGS
jgi:hypothetical protein